MKYRDRRRSAGFTLVELLVVIAILAMLAAVTLGALAKTRESARLAATKATVAKLNDLVMQRYQSYAVRRVPINLTGMSPAQAAQTRLKAIRDLMRMEMPERWNDVTSGPIVQNLAEPSLHKIYQKKYSNPATYGMKAPGPDHAHAKCLYLWLTTAMPESKGMFTNAEIADVDGDGWKTFVDGWGRPISFLRWAPGFTPNSGIQFNDADHHDPLDPRNVDPGGYELIPLIYAGVVSQDANGYDDYGLSPGQNIKPSTSPCTDNQAVGQITSGGPLVTNHLMEQK